MPKYRVTLNDDRKIEVYAPNPQQAEHQAVHHEVTRRMINEKRGLVPGMTDKRGVPVDRPAGHVAAMEVIKERA